ncbi:diaminopimelate epimerase [Halolactibacillus miurensis]|uniref:Diaminopimelate epimerase n=1 Tax=Halolactibacillus miurensis TaxID=306541 RepID=A0A1I6RE66_9BACI|nr:diaminopimelate epimerase [Halolactibacillus miurensis]GEM05484.1 diaminopimelate epimerase [Halolactibacillus miurensis]SFS62778.1 diaminopimelate epimerase [Halolactibacillus miurensis]
MKEIHYTKMHGLGNSYIYINTFEETLAESELISLAIKVSNKNTGIGSDGLILITPSDQADVGMRMFNKDGSEGKTCGNGLRCVAKYAFEHQLVQNETFAIETKAGMVEAYVHLNKDQKEVNEVTIDMGAPILERQLIPMLGEKDNHVVNERFEVENETLFATAVSMGNPHVIFFVDDINQAPLYELGPVITNDNRFPEGVNVEFIEVISETEMHFRVWERGSGVTEACGTGACAATVASVLNGQSKRNEPVTVHLAGGDLTITWAHDGKVWMRGAAETITTGIYFDHSKH